MSSTSCLNIRSFTFWIGCVLFAEVFGMGYFRSVLTTIERRFSLPSATIALLSSSFQIGSTTVMIFVCYFGSRYHRPRTIATGSILVALGFFLSMVPQFVGDRYEFIDISLNKSSGRNQPSTCDLSSGLSNQSFDCTNDISQTTSKSNLYWLIFVGIMLCGIGASPLQPLGISYIDDHASEQNTAMYIGILNSMGLIGPALSFLLGSMLLKIWVDIGWIDTSTIDITPKHPGWVGAWWVGFIFPAIILCLASIPLFSFPAKLDKKEENKNNTKPKKSQAEEIKTENIHAVLKLETRGLMAAFKRLFTNKRYLILILLWTVEGYRGSGFAVFLMKYIEIAFRRSASQSSFLIGTTCLPCLVLGVISGSLFIKRWKLDIREITRLVLVALSCSCLLCTPLMFISCDMAKIAGLTVPYPTERLDVEPTNVCNSDCNCKEIYTPVCGPNNITYLTPCYAGCTDFISDELGEIKVYTSCQCIGGNSNDSLGNHSVALGHCNETSCDGTLIVGIVLLGLSSWFGGLHITPLLVLVMRTLRPEDKAFGMGMGFFTFRVLAYIPGPIIFGYMIDKTCLFWTEVACSKGKLCSVYDNSQYRYIFFGLATSLQVVAITIAAIYYHKYARQDVKKINEEQDKTTFKQHEVHNEKDETTPFSLLQRIEACNISIMKESVI